MPQFNVEEGIQRKEAKTRKFKGKEGNQRVGSGD